MRFPVRVIYVAGPISPSNGRTMLDNINQARQLAVEVWRVGAYPFTPHLNSTDGVLRGMVSGSDIYLADLAMLERCDAVLLMEGWETSRGANYEVAWADYKDKPVFYSIEQLERWLDGQG